MLTDLSVVLLHQVDADMYPVEGVPALDTPRRPEHMPAARIAFNHRRERAFALASVVASFDSVHPGGLILLST